MQKSRMGGPNSGPMQQGLFLQAIIICVGVIASLSGVGSTALTASGSCELPSHWEAKWYHTNNNRNLDITKKTFNKNRCVSSLGDNYILHQRRKNCYRCLVISEKHPNILEYKRSKCKPPEDLDTLCSEVAEDSYLLIREDSSTLCPWVGDRSFSFQMSIGLCSEKPSHMYSKANDTEIQLLYNPCPEQTNPNVVPYPQRLRCIADWKQVDGEEQYFLGKRPNWYGPKSEGYRCFTYIQEDKGRQVYRAGSVVGTKCRSLTGGGGFQNTYKINGLSEAPSAPVIEGYSPSDLVQVGDLLKLTCVTYGGFPIPKIEWFRNEEKLESDTSSRNGRHEAEYRIKVAESDESVQYQCRVSNFVTVPKLIANVTITFKKDYSCELPSTWEDRWYQFNDDSYVDIKRNEFNNTPCISSLGHSYLLHDEKNECNSCVVITEKHQNVLEYKISDCNHTEDLNSLCSEVGEESYLLIREDSMTQCPWVGARSFSYKTALGCLSRRPSEMYTETNDTEIYLFYNPCPEQTNPNIVPYRERLRCIADWKEVDSEERYFLGENPNWYGRKTNGYRCFTYIREEMGRQVFWAGSVVGAKCLPLAGSGGFRYGSFDKTYKIYGLSEAPSDPVIEDYSSTDLVQVGDLLQLTCVTYGGFPSPKIEWFRNEEKLESDTNSRNGTHKAGYTIQVAESDSLVQYQCRVSNFVTVPELTANFTITFEKDSCELPSTWEDRWYQFNNNSYVVIKRNEFNHFPCISSLGHSYLLHDVINECNSCVVITEKHQNVLEYKISDCNHTEDLNSLCSEVEEESYLLIREDSMTQCPWVGARSFSYKTALGCLSRRPSEMYTETNDTEIYLFYNPCPEQTNPNIVPYRERLRCIADWKEVDSEERYFLGENPNWYGRKTNGYRCFTYIREEMGRQVFWAGSVVGAKCLPLAGSGGFRYGGFDKTYKIYGLSEAPSDPVIEDYSSTDLVQVGDLLQLTCVTYGGFPSPKIEWFRNEEKLESHTNSRNGTHKAGYTIQVAESDRSVQYQCRVSNFVTVPELTANFTITFEKGSKRLDEQGVRHRQAFQHQIDGINHANAGVNAGVVAVLARGQLFVMIFIVAIAAVLFA